MSRQCVHPGSLPLKRGGPVGRYPISAVRRQVTVLLLAFDLILLQFSIHERLQSLLLQPPRLVPVVPIVVTFDLPLQFLHLLCLPFPFGLTHLRLSAEQLIVWLPITSTQSVPYCRKLSIIIIEVQMVHGVTCGAVDYV